jgi:CubicO group peptidase (beta-lactamase class C family)
MEELADLDRLAGILATQAPAWTPGAHQGYHGITLGWYEGALLQRVDPKGRTLGQFFADEVAGPLGLEFHIGLPGDVDHHRIATIHGYKPAEMMLHLHQMPPRFVRKFMNPKSLSARCFQNPKVLGKIDNYNREDVQRVEIPAANGVGLVRSVAAAYGSFATGGAECGLTQETLAALEEPARPPTEGLYDLVLHLDTLYSLGYFKPFPKFRFGGSEWRSYGTFGAGGSFGFADPEYGVGFCYAPNRSQFRFWDDAREVALRQAVYDVLGGPPQRPD